MDTCGSVADHPAREDESGGIPDAVLRTAIFQTEDSVAVAAMTARLPRLAFKARQTIYVEGEIGHRLYIVVSGKVKLGRQSPDGRSMLTAVVGPSDVFGDVSIFDPGPRTTSATALTEVSVLTMDREQLRGWLVEHPDVADRLLRMLAHRLRHTDHDLFDLVFTDTPGRVAKQLLRLAQRFGVQQDDAMRVDHGLSQGEIGQLVGASRETVNKILTDFVQRGWIRTTGKSVIITATESLVRRARRATVTDTAAMGGASSIDTVLTRSRVPLLAH